MKNLSMIIALSLILVLLTGCSMRPGAGKTDEENVPAVTAGTAAPAAETAAPEAEVTVPAEEVTVPAEEAGDASYAELGALLDTVHGRYFPGTAGSSLSAAACAAELADFFAESGMTPDAVDRVVQDYYAFLPQEDAELFETQIDGIVGAFSSLTGENGAGLLDDCGYASIHFPWDEENIRNCFTAMLGSD